MSKKQPVKNVARNMKKDGQGSPSDYSRAKLTPNALRVNESVIAGAETALRSGFVKTLIYPDEYSERIPDELTQPTVLYRSLREFALIVNMDGTIDAGRFSFAVKPILGNFDSPNHYQVGIVDSSVSWPDDFSLPSSYVQQNLYSDPRQDPMALPLLSNLPGEFYTRSQDNIGGTGRIEGSPFSGPGSISYQTSRSSNLNPIITNSPFQLSGQTFGADVNLPTYYKFPAGVYTFNPSAIVTTNFSSLNPCALNIYSVNAAGIVDGDLTFRVGNDDQEGYLAGAVINRGWCGNIYNTNQSTFADVSFDIVLDGEHSLVFGVFIPSGQTLNGLSGSLMVNVSTNSILPFTSNSGSVIKIRPVACSALVTCTLPDLTAGGNIVGYSAPSGDIDDYYYKTSAVIGSFQQWQNLARVNKGINVHDGNFKDGVYVWTQPWDTNDTLMRTPGEALNYHTQGIIVSGQVNPTVNLTGNVEVGRIRIVLLYEYTTDNRLFTPVSCFGSTADLDWVLAYLATCQHATENVTHAERLKAIVKGAASWVTRSIPSMMKGLELASGIAKLAL
jgi:hypothetical protein